MLEDCGPGCTCRSCCDDDSYLDNVIKTKVKESKNDDFVLDEVELSQQYITSTKSYIVFHYYQYFVDPTYLKTFISFCERVLDNKYEVDRTMMAIKTKGIVCETIPFFKSFKPEEFEILFLDFFLAQNLPQHFQQRKKFAYFDQHDKVSVKPRETNSRKNRPQYLQTNTGGIKSISEVKSMLSRYLKLASGHVKDLKTILGPYFEKKVEGIGKMYANEKGISNLKTTFSLLHEHLYIDKIFVYREKANDYRTFLIECLADTLFDKCHIKFDFKRFFEENRCTITDFSDLTEKPNSKQFLYFFNNTNSTLSERVDSLLGLFDPGS